MNFPKYTRLAAALAACALVASCGGGGGGGDTSSPAPTPVDPSLQIPVVSLTLTPATVLPNQEATLVWNATNATSCTASGSWAGEKGTSGSAKVAQSATGTYNYGISCTGANQTAVSAFATLTVSSSPDTTPTSNSIPMSVHSGPQDSSFNAPMVSVTVCQPGTSFCQTIDNILVDTGSYGLRIIASGGLDSTLKSSLPAVTNAAGNAVAQCAQFVSGFTWGSVRRADVRMGGELAGNIPVQIISDSSAPYNKIPTDCSNAGANMGTVASLGANGILGVGLFKEDCGVACANQVIPALYYGCTSSGCSGTRVAMANQVSNPVSSFAVNNNGVVLELPAVGAGGVETVTGTLTFGIGTQANNQLGSAKVYAADAYGNFITTYKGQSYTSSFLDSGSNGLFFPDSTIASCPEMGGWFCPSVTLSLTAVNSAYNGSTSGAVNFMIENPAYLRDTARVGHIGADTSGFSGIHGFDWGLPFFLGRKVFNAIEGAPTPAGIGPYWAY